MNLVEILFWAGIIMMVLPALITSFRKSDANYDLEYHVFASGLVIFVATLGAIVALGIIS